MMAHSMHTEHEKWYAAITYFLSNSELYYFTDSHAYERVATEPCLLL